MLINYFVWLIDVAPPPDDVKSFIFNGSVVWFHLSPQSDVLEIKFVYTDGFVYADGLSSQQNKQKC